MVNILLPDERSPFLKDRQHILVYYLAMEEYVAAHIAQLLPDAPKGEKEAFFIWQVNPTVIFGRNQVMEAEVNVKFALERGIHLYRRKSGGGCVFSDRGNIMLSYVSDTSDVTSTFDKYLNLLAGSIKALGVPAEVSGRNDIQIGGRKVSGNAFFHTPSSSIVHGTLLFDADFETMQQVLTPSRVKVKSKGVDSVRQHVTNLKEELVKAGNGKYSDINMFGRHLIRFFCPGGKELVLDDKAVAEIERIVEGYLDPAFLNGRKHEFTAMKTFKIDGVGEMALELDMEGEKIRAARISGDYFALEPDFEKTLSEALAGAEKNRASAMKALENIDLGKYVLNLRAEDFVSAAFDD